MKTDTIYCYPCRPSRGGVDRNADQPENVQDALTSPLAWGRGSKLQGHVAGHQRRMVAPRVGAWIETTEFRHRQRRRRSPLAWGRGSKHMPDTELPIGANVAPRVGAWIETDTCQSGGAFPLGRPSRGGVDRNHTPTPCSMCWRSRPSRGSVDRNIEIQSDCSGRLVAPRVGAWIETTWSFRYLREERSRPSRGGVDRNHVSEDWRVMDVKVAPRVGAWIETLRLAHTPTIGRSPLAWGRGSKHFEWLNSAADLSRPSRGGVDRNSVRRLRR